MQIGNQWFGRSFYTYIHTHGIGLSIRVMLNTKPASQVLIICILMFTGDSTRSTMKAELYTKNESTKLTSQLFVNRLLPHDICCHRVSVRQLHYSIWLRMFQKIL